VGGWLGRVEQRLAGPDVADVIQAQAWVLEQVTGLLIDLEGPVLVEVVDVEPVHEPIVVQASTPDYVRLCNTHGQAEVLGDLRWRQMG